MESIKCPGCNANLEYSIEDEKLQCKYCGTISNIEEEKNVDIDILEERMIEVNEAICPDCGAKLMTDINTMSTKCAYCGSALIYNQNIKAFSPKKILLFEKDIEEIKSNTLEKLYALGLKGKEELVESLKPIYLPYWLYYCDAEVLHNFSIKNVVFDNVLIDASKKVKDNIADLVELSFNLNKLRKFDKSMIVGHFAEKYDVESDSVFDRAVKKMEEDMIQNMPDSSFVYVNPKPTYILLPFYYAEKNEEQLLVNAQSGKLCCNNITDQEYQILNTHITNVEEITNFEVPEEKETNAEIKTNPIPILEKLAWISFGIFFVLLIVPFLLLFFDMAFIDLLIFLAPRSFIFFVLGCVLAVASTISIGKKEEQ